MWIIAKIDKKNFNNLKNDFKKKIENIIIYKPVFLREIINRNNVVKKKVDLFNDYIFCYHKDFQSSSTINNLKFSKGLKYFLNNSKFSQKNIIETITTCKKNENSDGTINEKFVQDLKNNKIMFFLGPLRNLIFDIKNIKSKKIYFNFGNFKASINNSST